MMKDNKKKADLVSMTPEEKTVPVRVPGSVVPKFEKFNDVAEAAVEMEEFPQVEVAAVTPPPPSFPSVQETSTEILDISQKLSELSNGTLLDVVIALEDATVQLKRIADEIELSNNLSMREDLEALQVSPEKQRAFKERMRQLGK